MNIAEGDYLPIVRVAPVYPARALSRGLEGYVDMAFTVTTTGTVKDPVVVFSTSSLFERAAIRAVLKFKYKPRVVDGVASLSRSKNKDHLVPDGVKRSLGNSSI
jgi:protein TonB